MRALWMVSSWRVRSYGREKMVAQGRPVDGLIRSHRCGPAWPSMALVGDMVVIAAPGPPPGLEPSAVACEAEWEGDEGEMEESRFCRCEPPWLWLCRWSSRLCFCNCAGVSKRCRQPWYVHVYVPVSSAAVLDRRRTSPDEESGALSLMLVSIDVRWAGNSGFASPAPRPRPTTGAVVVAVVVAT